MTTRRPKGLLSRRKRLLDSIGDLDATGVGIRFAVRLVNILETEGPGSVFVEAIAA